MCSWWQFMHLFRLCRHVRCISVILRPWPTLPFAISGCLQGRCAHMLQHPLQHADIQLRRKPFIMLGIGFQCTTFARNLRKIEPSAAGGLLDHQTVGVPLLLEYLRCRSTISSTPQVCHWGLPPLLGAPTSSGSDLER